ncbi:MAG: DNA-binding protein [Ruminococcaceae bacterium]|nr:DNA-binding protein [Oscillospiraceae bacterium]
MFEKDMSIGLLLDFYGDILPERKRTVMDMYYNEDLSLAEIATEIGISRQGVRDMIKKSSDELFFYEEKLGLAARLGAVRRHAEQLTALAQKHDMPKPIADEIEALLQLITE